MEILLIQLIGGLCLFFIVISMLKHYFEGRLLPLETWILILGVGYSLTRTNFIPPLPELKILPEVVFFVFLPVLIFDSARRIDLRRLQSESAPIAFFAFVGMIVSAIILGATTMPILQVGLIHALLFGVIVSATDPVSVGSIFTRFEVPKKLKVLIEGESLFNDATVLVLFSILSMTLLNGVSSLSASEVVLHFVWSLAGAIPLGILLGWLAAKVLDYWNENEFTETTFTLVIAYLAFVVGEHFLHVSGVVTVLAAAIAFSSTENVLKNCESHLYDDFWKYLSFLFNSILFFLLGVGIGAHHFPIGWYIVLIPLALLMARAFVVYGGCLLLNARSQQVPQSWQHVLNLGGLKGAFSILLLLLLPEDYPHREMFLCAAFVIIFFSLVFHPLALRWYLKRAKFDVRH